MRKLWAALESWRRRRALSFWAARDCAVFPLDSFNRMEVASARLTRTLNRSGFLRNNATHTAKCRHAERTLRRSADVFRDCSPIIQ